MERPSVCAYVPRQVGLPTVATLAVQEYLGLILAFRRG